MGWSRFTGAGRGQHQERELPGSDAESYEIVYRRDDVSERCTDETIGALPRSHETEATGKQSRRMGSAVTSMASTGVPMVVSNSISSGMEKGSPPGLEPGTFADLDFLSDECAGLAVIVSSASDVLRARVTATRGRSRIGHRVRIEERTCR